MNKHQKLKEINKAMVGAEMELSLLELDVLEIKDELAKLNLLKHELDENVKFLKKEGVAAMILEYQRSLNQVVEIKKEISKRTKKLNIAENELKEKKKSYEFYKAEHEQMIDEVKNEKVVLLFKRKSND